MLFAKVYELTWGFLKHPISDLWYKIFYFWSVRLARPGDLFSFSDLGAFTQNISVEWVVSVLDLSAQASIQRRWLPTDQNLCLVLGMALFRDEPVRGPGEV